MAIFTAIETYFFNDAMIREDYLFAGFFAYLILRNFYLAHVASKIAKVIEKQIKKK
ncbi:multidrug ABC transporter ATPase/permease [Streptococcus massiliensis]|uniref:Multidrug ABC transporter ATPase/permease n=2 Tax=Streptococcus massiliensis TaxID=313439 RepID=A0A380KY09_9STRE|nr:multidrug ABC transporter ATPase/permease [Streptococcus massiliensis]